VNFIFDSGDSYGPVMACGEKDNEIWAVYKGQSVSLSAGGISFLRRTHQLRVVLIFYLKIFVITEEWRLDMPQNRSFFQFVYNVAIIIMPSGII